MLNNTKLAIRTAKATLKDLLIIHCDSIPCEYNQSGRVIKGDVIQHIDKAGNDIYDQIRPDVRVRSHTGKEYYILITSIVSIEGLGEL